MADKLDDLMPKVLPLLRMLVSGTDGEVVNSIAALRRVLANANLDIHVLIERVELSTVTARQQLYDFGYEDGRADEAEEQRRKTVAAQQGKPSISPRNLDDEFDDDVGPGINGFSWHAITQHLMTNLSRIRAQDQSIVESVHRGLFDQASPRRAPNKQDGYATFSSGNLPGRSFEPGAKEIEMTEALLAGITRKPRTRAGLIIGLDATASREHCWDIASQLQSEMFQAAASAGGLEVQLVYYRGLAKFGGECKASPWTDDPAVLVKLMAKIRCLSGVTQIGAVLKHALREASQRKVGALCFVGDAAEEPRSQLISPARELAGVGVPAFMFQEGEDPTARSAFKEIAQVTGGAFGVFDANSARMLADLLKAVAVFASGGRLALEKQGGPAARLLLSQLGKR